MIHITNCPECKKEIKLQIDCEEILFDDVCVADAIEAMIKLHEEQIKQHEENKQMYIDDNNGDDRYYKKTIEINEQMIRRLKQCRVQNKKIQDFFC